MKKCPACNRTYSDETLSFCLEDGSLLSASFNLHEEPETVVRPNKAELAPTEFFQPELNEIPTIVSNQNANPPSRQSPKTRINKNLIVLLALSGFVALATLYTQSAIPFIAGLVIILIYTAVWLIIRKIKLTK